MPDSVLVFFSSTTFLVYASIPLVSALIGWFTNWLAIKMTFYPVEFRGLGPIFGWQGIIPRNSERIVGKTADLVTKHLVSVEEVISRVEPARFSEQLEPIYDRITDEVVEEVISAQSPAPWEVLPRALKLR